MDRNVEFFAHLAHLVALYATPEWDATAERGALRAARAAAKHGACELLVTDGVPRAGTRDLNREAADVSAVASLLVALGVTRVRVAHHAKQDDIKALARIISGIASGAIAPSAFGDALAEHQWTHVDIQCAVPPAASDAAADAPASDTAPSAAPVETPAEPAMPDTDGAAEGGAEPSTSAGEAPTDAVEEESAGPLATALPEAAAAIVPAPFREHFDHLITASSPGTLRRFLEPIQLVIEQQVREGNAADAVRTLLAMLACETCTDDDEMRRQFVVVLRRLTKPTLLRAIAMLYDDDASCAAYAEQALLRFGEDGAEAVIDRVASAPTAEARANYLALLARLPAANYALAEMLDDERALVVERAIDVLNALEQPGRDSLFGELLGHASPRVRQAAARGLAASGASTFAADALLRAVQDSSTDVRLAAAVALQSRREARLADPLAGRLDDEPELEVQLALIAALGRLGADSGVQKLIGLALPNERMLRRRNPGAVRLSAIEALGEARTPAAMSALQKLLEDREKEVREAAARLYSRARRQTSSMSIPTVTDG